LGAEINDQVKSSAKRPEGSSAAAPRLIIVTGRPASGKTTLARWLAQEIHLPVVSKDSIREVLFERLGWKDRPWAQLLGRVSIDLMFHFAEMQCK
jgi:predicted kinase